MQRKRLTTGLFALDGLRLAENFLLFAGELGSRGSFFFGGSLRLTDLDHEPGLRAGKVASSSLTAAFPDLSKILPHLPGQDDYFVRHRLQRNPLTLAGNSETKQPSSPVAPLALAFTKVTGATERLDVSVVRTGAPRLSSIYE